MRLTFRRHFFNLSTMHIEETYQKDADKLRKEQD